MTQTDPKELWKAYKNAPGAGEAQLSIGLAGSFTLDPLVPYLGGQLLHKGFAGPELNVGPYNQIHQLCLNPENVLGKASDVITILWRLEDVFADLQAENITEDLDHLLDSVAALRKNFSGTLIVSTPPYPSTPDFDVHDLQQAETGAMLYQSLLGRWVQGLADIGGIKILDLQGILMQLGFETAHDARKWYLYKQPLSEGAWAKIGAQLARIIAAQTLPAKKCIVVDCDNTLWGGIVGEDGVGGLDLGEDFPGSAFQDFQKYLVHLRSKGLFLAVASKNNEDDVYEVFDTHDAMALKRDHISAFEVHWDSKVGSLQNIAKELNIGTDALVFVDDNPKEIAEVEQRLPEVTCLLVPEEPAYLPDLLRNTGLFDIAEITEEDRKRADMVMAENRRKSVATEMTEEDFLKSLELKIDVFEAEEQHLARVTQLINKTNQFNLTTIRRTQDEVEALAGDPDTLLLAMSVADRFGDYGLVGVAIVQKQSDSDWNIETLLMSCRVLGRSAETSFLAKIAEAVKSKGGNKLTGTYVPTAKNVLVKDLYKTHGFDEDGDNWAAALDQITQPPDYVRVSLTLLN